MENTAQRDTPAELALRRELHRRGLRFRVDSAVKGITRSRPDMAFPTEKVAVFVDGCFWHFCPEHGTMPEANRAWWQEKLRANVARDRRHDRELTSAGWEIIRIWEHEDPINAADVVEGAVLSRRSGG